MSDLPPGSEAPSFPVTAIAVIGAGDRGRSFARRCVQAGFAVVLEDVLSSKLRQAALEMEAALPPFGALRFATSVEEAVREADFAIDFVPDELESKLEILSMMDRMAPPRTLFCTPTALSLADLASCTYRAPQCVALRFFEGEAETQAELVRTHVTADTAVAAVQGLLERLGIHVQLRYEQDGADRVP